jgi:hypothetical protein
MLSKKSHFRRHFIIFQIECTLGAGCPGSILGRTSFLFIIASKPVLGPAQCPVRLAPWATVPGVKAAGSLKYVGSRGNALDLYIILPCGGNALR